MAIAVLQNVDGKLQSTDQIVVAWKKRIEQSREARKPFEWVWLSNLAFAGGQHWLAKHERSGQMRHLSELDPRYANRNLYTADRITEYMRAQLGELSSGSDRLDLQAVHDGDEGEQVTKELNSAVQYAWEHEWNAQKALRRARGYALTMGVSALRMRFDPTKGPVAGRLPVGQDGQPATDPDELESLQQNGTLTDGSLPRYEEINEGRTCLEPLTAFQMFTPPGIPHEDDFPWEAIGRPVPLDLVLDEFGEAAAGLTEDRDIASAAGIAAGRRIAVGSNQARLRDHVWLYTCYDRPCKRYPQGRVVVLAGNSYRLLQVQEKLDYQKPNGDFHTGIVYLHWQRLDDRFQSRAFIENLKDGQRTINEIKTTQLEILWRGLPKVFTKEGDLIHDPAGLPLENIELRADAAQPSFFAGIGAGPWMDAMIASCDNDLSHASTLSPLKLGENPKGVDTYSQLQLLNQNENYKRSDIIIDHEQQIATLEELGVYDIRTYWPDEKKIIVAGDEGQLQEQTFRKSRIPDFFHAKVAKGVALDRSEAAELSKVDAIWAAAMACGLADDPANREKWLRWYAESLDAGESRKLPELQSDSQEEVAEFENFLMVQQGEEPVPSEYDLAPVHNPRHREAQDRARAAGDQASYERIQTHIEQHVQMAAVTRKAWRTFDPADVQDVASDIALDEDQALRENQMLLAGAPLNPEALQQAIQSVQQGQDPETGQQFDPQAVDVHAILIRASLKPTLVENLQVHLDRHGKVIKSKQFATFPSDARGRFIDHFNQTRDLWLSLPTMPEKVDAPKVSLNLRESVGPSTIAEVLRRAGVPEADAQTVATEPPMENMIKRDDPPVQADQTGEHYPPRGPL
jgi:hypothetical protein